MSRRTRCIALALATVAACKGGERSGGEALSTSTPAAKPKPTVAPYQEKPLGAMGRVTGTVEIEGTIPTDSVVHVSTDAQLCGATISPRTIEVRRNRPANVVVWLEGVRNGKPMPLVRRYTVVHERCEIVPRVQAGVVGGTLNVVNDERIAHTTRVMRAGEAQTLATVRQTLEGQVVPLDQPLKDPGLLTLACELHPWTRGWVWVFDHPYFTTSSGDGTFSIDSVPPGRYRIVAWHERLGEMSDSVTVGEGEAKVALKGRAK